MRISDWWPVGTHSISVDEGGDGAPIEVVFEPHTGGRVFEQNVAGEELAWAEMLVYEPPSPRGGDRRETQRRRRGAAEHPSRRPSTLPRRLARPSSR